LTGGTLGRLGAQAVKAALSVALFLFCPLESMIGPLPEVLTLMPCSCIHDTNFAGTAGPLA